MILINEFLADPASGLSGDANGDGTRDARQDEFVELVNNSGSSVDISGWTVSDGIGVRHTFPDGTVLAAEQAVVVFGGGTPTGNFGGAIAQTASSGALGFNNTGDTITLKDGTTERVSYSYGSEGGNEQSLTRDPDLTGDFILHGGVNAGGGRLFSPGTQVDGVSFVGNLTPIYEIQGDDHIPPLFGQVVTTRGIVTAVGGDGFYVQDQQGDGNLATSDGLFVFTGSSPGVTVGDAVDVTGTVNEFVPGGLETGNLSITELSGNPTVTLISAGNPLPAATVIGLNGRIPPEQIIDNDGLSAFNPDEDGIDFYESLEGMLLQVDDPVAVSPTSRFGEITVLADNGAGAGLRTQRGGIVVRPEDFNPERIIIDDALVGNEPTVQVGDRFENSIQGVLSYSFGNFKLLNTQPLPAVIPSNLQPESTELTAGTNQLTVATYNVENLDSGDAPAKFDRIAEQIITQLNSPDIIGLQEIQDNSGETDNGIVAADETFQQLIDTIAAKGGPTYDYRQVNPLNNQDGGAPGSNIRVGYLFNSSRVQFRDRGTLDATTSTTLTPNGVLSPNPGRIDPTNPAFAADGQDGFAGTRKSLAAEFIFNGETVYVINNHFKSKGGDDPLLGVRQPPNFVTESQRVAQAQVINEFIASILAKDPNANIITLGDFNDFPFSDAVQTVKGDALTGLLDTLPTSDRYTFNFNGNSQALDNLLVSDNLKQRTQVDIVHANSEFSNSASDHDPIVAQVDFNIDSPLQPEQPEQPEPPKPPIPPRLLKNANNIFEVQEASQLRLTLQTINTQAVNEIGVIKVDDAAGSVQGLKPGEAGFLDVALEQAQVVFSPLPETIFDPFPASRVVAVQPGEQLLFYMVQDSTTATVRASLGTENTPTVLFANNGSAVDIEDLNREEFTLRWDDGLGGESSFEDIIMNLEFAPEARAPIGTGLQGKSEYEFIDLRGLGTLDADITVKSEAKFFNTVGLYVVDNEAGQIDSLNPEDEGYAEAAIERALTDFGPDTTVSADLEGLLLPFIIANGTVEDFLTENPENSLISSEPIAYFPFMSANPDQTDHIRLLGDNLFGFEDLTNGGDADYNDMVVQVTFG
ncbi:MAG: DUF4114 domain-containing protein [Kamptonema sp. SIO4C4]|nr:DUF4114 domain-containing protein [Kamptonema sp. SIO4C4]